MGIKKSALQEPPLHRYEMANGHSPEDLQEVSQDILATLESNDKIELYALDFGACKLEYKLLRPLTVLAAEIKRKQKKLYLVTTAPEVTQLLVSEGVSGVIRSVASMEELQPTRVKRASLDVGFVNPFIEGVITVFQVQCSLECIPGKPVLKAGAGEDMKTDIAGVIGISSAQFAGSISICFPQKTFLKVMSKMFGEEYSEISKDLEDGAGELLNMVFGHAKRVLNEKGHSFEKALPTVVRGNGITMNHMGVQDAIVLPFQVEGDSFHIEICTEKK